MSTSWKTHSFSKLFIENQRWQLGTARSESNDDARSSRMDTVFCSGHTVTLSQNQDSLHVEVPTADQNEDFSHSVVSDSLGPREP